MLSGADHIDLLDALQFLTAICGTRMAPWRISVSARDAAELAGTQNVAGIRECGGDADRAGLLIHLAVDEDDVALVRIMLAIGKSQGEGHVGMP